MWSEAIAIGEWIISLIGKMDWPLFQIEILLTDSVTVATSSLTFSWVTDR
jgi:hypothetical protein